MVTDSEDWRHTVESALYLVGPTAVGKTELAVAVAEHFGAEIVGCDAFQIYEGLPLLTAKPSLELLERVPHHLIGEVPLDEEFDVAKYRALAIRCISEIKARGKVPLLVGGTGLYLRALTRGLADTPPGDPRMREHLQKQALSDLQEQLKRVDPVGYGQIDLQNSRRVIRALEVFLLSGRPFSSFQDDWQEIPQGLRGVFLDRDRTELYERIDFRVHEMFKFGVTEEVAGVGQLSPTATQTLGFKEIQATLRGELPQQECIEQIQRATRKYAKRQITWFRRETWLQTVNLSRITGLRPTVDTVCSLLRSSVS